MQGIEGRDGGSEGRIWENIKINRKANPAILSFIAYYNR